jgi:hypothetical protein
VAELDYLDLVAFESVVTELETAMDGACWFVVQTPTVLDDWLVPLPDP